MSRPLLYLAIGTAGALAPLTVRNALADRYCYTQWEDVSAIDNAPYDGRFTFFRVRFEPSSSFGGRGRRGGGNDKKWDHDTPRADRHLMKILEEITTLRPKMDCNVIYPFGDPESFKYPIAYVSEPGFWTMDETELKGIREYVAKGGFIIFDDFQGQHWYNFEERWRQAFPDLQLQPVPRTNPLFDAFYDIRATPLPAAARLSGTARSRTTTPPGGWWPSPATTPTSANSWSSPTRPTSPSTFPTRRTRSW